MLTFTRLGKAGRLGNQLFQVAFLATFADRHGIEYAIPPWRYASYFKQTFNMRNDLDQISFDLVIKEPSRGYNEGYFVELLPRMRKGNVNIISGYFESSNYFSREQARKLFSQKKRFRSIGKLEKCVAISFRRGDFVWHPNYNYIDADQFLKLLDLHFKNFKVFVFTDDYCYCRANFTGPQYEFLDDMKDIEQLQMMSQFDYFILSNSTFSYWGAMLSARPKLVFYPEFMFPDLQRCRLYNSEYWPKDRAYVSYKNPINKPIVNKL